jgi:hypothetical protein
MSYLLACVYQIVRALNIAVVYSRSHMVLGGVRPIGADCILL